MDLRLERESEWERVVTAELYKEYRSVLWQYRVSLRPVAIQLFESESFWGKWDPLTRTILISKKLVHQYSWFYVQGILRHEMAHQLAEELSQKFEVSGFRQDGKPHGLAFQSACSKLGVSGAFARAEIQLQETNLDWRTNPDDAVSEESEKLLDKVKKLLALATSSNEHEAYLAMSKVRELYAKYQLQDAPRHTAFVHLVISHGKKRIESHQARIVSILVQHFFVEVLNSSLFDAKSGEYHRSIELIGTRENVLMAEYVYYFLLQQLDFWVRESTQELKTSSRKTQISRVQRKSFRLGILEGFSEKLTRDERQSQPHSKAESPATGLNALGSQSTELSVIGKALTQFRKDKTLRDYLSTVYPRTTVTSSAGQTIDGSAFYAGRAVGQSITLHQAVTGRNESSGRALEHLK